MKKMLILFICVFFVFYFKLQSQSYNEFITQAYSCAYIENDFNRAAFLFEKAFEIDVPQSAELYYAAKINFQIYSNYKFKNYLIQAINSGYANIFFLKKTTKIHKLS